MRLLLHMDTPGWTSQEVDNAVDRNPLVSASLANMGNWDKSPRPPR